jgi:hypothetical protein
VRIVPRLDFGETSRHCLLVFYACCIFVHLTIYLSLLEALDRRGVWRRAFLVKVLFLQPYLHLLISCLDCEAAC